MSKRLLSRMLLAVLGVGLILAIALIVTRPAPAVGQGPTPPRPVPASQTAPTPEVAPTTVVTPTAVPARTIRATGNLLAPSQVSLAFQATGLIKEIKVKEGDKVKSGDVLARLDTTNLDLLVIQAQTALTLQQINLDKVKAGASTEDIAVAKSNLDKAKVSLDQAQAAYDRIGGDTNPMVAMSSQVVALQTAYSNYQSAEASYKTTIQHPTDSELNTAQAQYEQARAALAIAKQNLSNTSLVAPFDGTILSVTPKAGEIASQGVGVITLADLTHMQVKASLDENTLARIQAGQSVKLTLDAFPKQALTGRVAKIALTGTSSGGVVSVPVTIDIDATDVPIYPGLSATIEFKTN